MKKALIAAIAAAAAIGAAGQSLAQPAGSLGRDARISHRQAERLRAELTAMRWLEQRYRVQVDAPSMQLVGVPTEGPRDAV